MPQCKDFELVGVLYGCGEWGARGCSVQRMRLIEELGPSWSYSPFHLHEICQEYLPVDWLKTIDILWVTSLRPSPMDLHGSAIEHY